MNSLTSRVSYLKGLMDGLDLKNDSKEAKIFSEIVVILESMANEIEAINSLQEELEEYVDAIDEDLTMLEEDYYDEDFDEDYDELDDYEELVCPKCNETIYLDYNITDDKDSITCPNCNEIIDIK